MSKKLVSQHRRRIRKKFHRRLRGLNPSIESKKGFWETKTIRANGPTEADTVQQKSNPPINGFEIEEQKLIRAAENALSTNKLMLLEINSIYPFICDEEKNKIQLIFKDLKEVKYSDIEIKLDNNISKYNKTNYKRF